MFVLVNNAILAWFLFVIWSTRDSFNVGVRLCFLADAVVSTILLVKHPPVAQFFDMLGH